MGLNRTPIAVACALLLAAMASAEAADRPACAGGVEISRAKVVRVEQNGVLVLADGRALILEGIRLPMGEADHAPARLADEARATLLAMAQDGTITGTAIPPKQDRYDRVRVQGFTGQWLQRALLEQGLARVSISPDRSECASQLFDFEAAARKAGRGLWSNPAYRIRTNRDDWRPDAGTYQLIEGKVARMRNDASVTELDFSTDEHGGLLVRLVAPRGVTVDMINLEGKRVRVRGVVQDKGGRPMITLSSPAQIEVLDR